MKLNYLEAVKFKLLWSTLYIIGYRKSEKIAIPKIYSNRSRKLWRISTAAKSDINEISSRKSQMKIK